MIDKDKILEKLRKLMNLKESALALSTQAEIDDFLKDEKIGKSRASSQNVDNVSAVRGYETGKNVEINKGIYAESVSEDRRLM